MTCVPAELTGQWEVGVVSCTVLNSPQGTPLSSQRTDWHSSQTNHQQWC